MKRKLIFQPIARSTVSVGTLYGRSAPLAITNLLQNVEAAFPRRNVWNKSSLAFNATDHNALDEIALGYEKDNNAGQ